MKIKRIKMNLFKRFTDLTISDLPESAKLIVLVGQNGSGKTSLFEAFNHWYKWRFFSSVGSRDYFEKNDGSVSSDTWFQKKVEIEFFGANQPSKPDLRGTFYFRTAYRNEPDFTVNQLNKQQDPTDSIKLQTLMQNDIAVSENYQRLIAQTLAGVYDDSNDGKTVSSLREELVGKLKTSLTNIFDDLRLASIGDPLVDGSFYFEKGASKNFHYKNLSSGEKSVFDLLLDMIIKEKNYPQAIYCIDEPEAHMHTRLQSRVLRELFRLTPAQSQLWIATHSIGMLKEAEDIETRNPGSVVFLDFDNKDFDLTENIVPSKASKAIWAKFFDLAIGDFSSLISPKRIVFCEGTPKGRQYQDFDAQIYAKIFEDKYHDTQFVSVGSCSELENIQNATTRIIANVLKASQIIKLIDRDDRSPAEIAELNLKKIKVTARRHIESYLLDDEVIQQLCERQNMPGVLSDCIAAKAAALQSSIDRGNPSDDVKSASGSIFNELKRILKLTQCGNNASSFMRDTMAPLITPETSIYKELEAEIFG